MSPQMPWALGYTNPWRLCQVEPEKTRRHALANQDDELTPNPGRSRSVFAKATTRSHLAMADVPSPKMAFPRSLDYLRWVLVSGKNGSDFDYPGFAPGPVHYASASILNRMLPQTR